MGVVSMMTGVGGWLERYSLKVECGRFRHRRSPKPPLDVPIESFSGTLPHPPTPYTARTPSPFSSSSSSLLKAVHVDRSDINGPD